MKKPDLLAGKSGFFEMVETMKDNTARITREQAEASLDLYMAPAIDRSAVLAEWRKTWRIVVRDLTPIQRKALELELGSADS